MTTPDFIPYKVLSGDTTDSIVKKFRIPDWNYLVSFDKNNKYRITDSSVNAGDVLYIPVSFVNLIQKDRTHEHVYTEANMKIFFDGHMHIQSNNCSTMVHQWAAIGTKNSLISTAMLKGNEKRRTAIPFGSDRPNRKDFADMGSGGLGTAVTGRLIKLGRLPTYLVANLYMKHLENNQILRDDAWIVMKPKEYNAPQYTASEMGKRAQLDKMNLESDNEDCRFMYQYKDCYKGAGVFRINCALTFDLTFAHFWGEYGIPVYFPAKTDDNISVIHYVNDFLTVNFKYNEYAYNSRKNYPGLTEYFTDIYPDTYAPYRNRPDKNVFPGEARNITMLARKVEQDEIYSMKDQFERFCRWEESSIFDRSKHDFFMHFSGDRTLIRKLVDKKYTLITEPIFPKRKTEYSDNLWQDAINERKWFEEYRKEQLLMSEAAALAYPMNYLLFYNYDPRAHCSKNNTKAHIDKLVQKMLEECAFFKYENGYPGVLTVKPAEELNSADYWKNLLLEHIRPNDFVFSHLLAEDGNGIYWGIKMYPRLGYDPSDFTAYPHLKELYSECIKLDIPIVIHCSQGGMMLADYHNYVRYRLGNNEFADNPSDQQKSRQMKEKAETYDIDRSDIMYTDSFASPENWKRVLDSGYLDLTLRLSNFGGFPVWESLGDFETLEKQSNNSDSKKVFTYNKWIKSTAELIDCGKYPNVYTDISCFTLSEDPVATSKVHKNLIYLLKKYPKLKERILLGTDWPMIEGNPSSMLDFDKDKGFGQYMNRLILVLQKVSRELGYDAFYQFGYLNQLRFLGLINESTQCVKTDLIEKYQKRLIKMLSEPSWLGSKYIPEKVKLTETDISGNIQPIIDSYKKSKIKKSDEIMTKDNILKILTYFNSEYWYT